MSSDRSVRVNSISSPDLYANGAEERKKKKNTTVAEVECQYYLSQLLFYLFPF